MFAWRRQLLDAAIARIVKKQSPQTLTSVLESAREAVQERMTVDFEDVLASIDRLCDQDILDRQSSGPWGPFETAVVFKEDLSAASMDDGQVRSLLGTLRNTSGVYGRSVWSLLLSKMALDHDTTTAIDLPAFRLGAARLAQGYRIIFPLKTVVPRYDDRPELLHGETMASLTAFL